MKILTKEEKLYLRRICRYLGSLGMKQGNIEMELEYETYDYDDINWNSITHFDNNYNAEIPNELYPILQKIFKYVSDNDLYTYPDVDSHIDYQRLDLEIDCETNEITLHQDYSYTTEADGVTTTITENEDEDLQKVFESISELQNETGNDDDKLELRYNGSGDSGYLEDDFQNGLSVPSQVEDYCYSLLESLHGGWEINEGSQGYFVFDTVDKVMNLYHANNEQINERETLYEEKF